MSDAVVPVLENDDTQPPFLGAANAIPARIDEVESPEAEQVSISPIESDASWVHKDVQTFPIPTQPEEKVAEDTSPKVKVDLPLEATEVKTEKLPDEIDLEKIEEQKNAMVKGDAATFVARYLGLVDPADPSININNASKLFEIVGESVFLPTSKTKQATYEGRFDLDAIGNSDAIGFVGVDDPAQKLRHILVPTYNPDTKEIFLVEKDGRAGSIKVDYIIDYDLPRSVKIEGPIKAVYLKSRFAKT